METQRYKLTLGYRGTNYHGWQRQARTSNYKRSIPRDGHDIPTVQRELTKALTYVVKHPVTVVGSSRTDAGVHATGQVAHFDTVHKQIPLDGFRRAINNALPDDILVHAIKPVPPTFDAIISAERKRYQYLIWSHTERPYLSADLSWHRWKPLDEDAMRAAAARLAGEHDFASFARPGHGRENTVRTVHACDVTRDGPRLVVGVEGGGFLWNMVRIMVGTLVDVGLGSYRPEDIDRMLAARDRRVAGGTAPPHGLYLQWVQTRDDPGPNPGAAASPLPEDD